jgi:3-oxoacyl-[acyl-carrier protein] reductase
MSRILLTGGTHGIGEALVRQARKAGHEVVFTGRNEQRLARVANETGAHGIRADVASPDDNARTVEQALERLGSIEVLVNNAACGYGAPVGEIDVEAMKRLFDTNIFGLVDLTNRVVPHMKRQGRGDIVNVASTSGMKGHAHGTAYAGSKWALRGISQCWQAELRPHDIRVICVCPSEVQTGWGGSTPGTNPKKLFADDIAGAILGCLSMHPRGFIPEFAVFATNPF